MGMQSTLENIMEVKEETDVDTTIMMPLSSSYTQLSTNVASQPAHDSYFDRKAVGLEVHQASSPYDQTLTDSSSADSPMTEITLPDTLEEDVMALKNLHLTEMGTQVDASQVPIQTQDSVISYNNVDAVEPDITLHNPYQSQHYPSYSLERPLLDFQDTAFPSCATRRDDYDDSGIFALNYSSVRSFDGSEFSEQYLDVSSDDKSQQLLDWLTGLSPTTLNVAEVMEQAWW